MQKQLFSTISLAAALSTVVPLGAQPGAAEYPSRANVGYIHLFDTDFDDGGEFSQYRAFGGAGTEWDLGGRSTIGVGLSYEYADFDFKGTSGFAAMDPWESIGVIQLSVPYSVPMGDRGLLGVTGFASFSSETDADWDDGFEAGATVSYAWQFSRALTLGVGGGGFYGLEDSSGYGFIFVRWQITERLVLANPFRPGPFGPAGLELAYRVADDVEIGVGAVYRSFRFALDDAGVAPGGYGAVEGVPAFMRVTWSLSDQAAVDLYGGAVFAGEATLDNADGDEITQMDYDTQMTAAVAGSWRF